MNKLRKRLQKRPPSIDWPIAKLVKTARALGIPAHKGWKPETIISHMEKAS